MLSIRMHGWYSDRKSAQDYPYFINDLEFCNVLDLQSTKNNLRLFFHSHGILKGVQPLIAYSSILKK